MTSSSRFHSCVCSAALSGILFGLCAAGQSHAQATQQPAEPIPQLEVRGITSPTEPAHPDPPAPTEFRDPKYKVQFHVPAGWNVEHRDGVLSNFGVDTRTKVPHLELRGVAAINYNPYPVSTFAGASFYYSVQSHSSPATCAAQASSGFVKSLPAIQLNGTTFSHGEDHHGDRCNEARDTVFTTVHGGACVRFDLVVNTFCPESSHMMEVSPKQLADIQSRLAGILQSVRFSGK